MFLLVTLLLIVALLAIVVYYYSDCEVLLNLYDRLYPNLNYYKNKVVWITGSSDGIGRDMAIQLAQVNARLILSGTNKAKLNQVQLDCIAKSNGKLTKDDVLILDFDLSDLSAAVRAYETVKQHFGRIDVLINNAGMVIIQNAIDLPIDQVERMFKVNLFANIQLSQLVVQDWRQTGYKGRILVTSSIASFIHIPLHSSYVSSKAALNAFYNSMRTELYHTGISVTVVCPGGVVTNILKRSYEENNQTLPDLSEYEQKKSFMKSPRCARLMLVAGANRFHQVVVANQPHLIGAFICQMFAEQLHFLLCLLLTKKRFEEMQKKLNTC